MIAQNRNVLLTPEEAAEVLRISPRTLRRMRDRDGPAYVTITSRTVRYRLEDITAFLDGAKQECLSKSKKVTFGNSISSSAVVDFGEVSARKTSRKRS